MIAPGGADLPDREEKGAKGPASDPKERKGAVPPAPEGSKGAEPGRPAPEQPDREETKGAGSPDPKKRKETEGADLPDLRYQSAGEALRAALLGACIGLAIIVPGVSGAAVAILFGLYEKLLAAIGGIFKQFRACALFLLPVALGGLAGLAVGFFAVRTEAAGSFLISCLTADAANSPGS